MNWQQSAAYRNNQSRRAKIEAVRARQLRAIKLLFFSLGAMCSAGVALVLKLAGVI